MQNQLAAQVKQKNEANGFFKYYGDILSKSFRLVYGVGRELNDMQAKYTYSEKDYKKVKKATKDNWIKTFNTKAELAQIIVTIARKKLPRKQKSIEINGTNRLKHATGIINLRMEIDRIKMIY